MKKLITILLIVPGLALAMIVATSCTKEGPAGPAGEDGIDGTDGTATCGQCHNSGEDFLAKVVQWEASTHANGGNFERNGNGCAPCHTSMGFREVIETGADTTAATVDNPTPINCYTCHKVHETYTADDWMLRYTDPVTFMQGGATADRANGNLCTKCHQSRPASPYPAMGAGTIEFPTGTSYRWGPHHGPQGNLLFGIGSGAYEIAGSMGYENSAHSGIENGCISCHMADAYGAQAGGHTFKMGYEYHGSTELNYAGCLVSGCHSNEDNLIAATENLTLEVEDLLVQLGDLLKEQGVMREDGYLTVPGTYTNAQAGAFYNFKFIEEDRSMAVHNPKYALALLNNSIEAIQ